MIIHMGTMICVVVPMLCRLRSPWGRLPYVTGAVYPYSIRCCVYCM